ncbi:MAG: multidrug efflux SMR transporter [Spirochaetaceae bacterium]
MGWLFLGLTIVSEVTGTTMMKLSEGYTKLIPSILSFVFYLGALALLTMTLKYLGMGISYAIWSGVGIVLVTIIGYLFFKEQITIQKIVFISLILFGVIGLKLTTN